MFRGGAKALQSLFVIALAVALAVFSLRDWSTRARHADPLSRLAGLWPGHPDNARDRLMIDSAVAAREGRTFDDDSRIRLRKLAEKAPLAPEPYLLAGALAQIDRDNSRAERLYLAARLRNPRGPAIRFLLADMELRAGNVEQGLENLVAIPRITRNMNEPVVASLAEFAQNPGSISGMRSVFRTNPALEQAVLIQLASDARNLSVIDRLAPEDRDPAVAPWQQRLLDTLVASGDVADARLAWAKFNRVAPPTPGKIFNASFERLPASQPFNWAVSSSAAGVAEIAVDGGLSIVHYGREPVMLARQLVLLAPGNYLLHSQFGRPMNSDRLEWRVQCLGGGSAIPSPASRDPVTFAISANCPSAWLELHALPGENQDRLDTILRHVELEKVG